MVEFVIGEGTFNTQIPDEPGPEFLIGDGQFLQLTGNPGIDPWTAFGIGAAVGVGLSAVTAYFVFPIVCKVGLGIRAAELAIGEISKLIGR